jgi:hypothetical protein
MFSVLIRPGVSAGLVTEVRLSRSVEHPGAIRSAGLDIVLAVERGLMELMQGSSSA